MPLVFLMISAAGAAEKAAPKQILHLSIQCEGVDDGLSRQFVRQRLKKHNAGADVHVVDMAWPCAGDDAAKTAAVQSLVGQLDEIVDVVPEFDLIALDLPDVSPGQPTYVMPLGYLSPTSLDDALKKALAPLEKKAKPRGKILMLAGHAVRGEPQFNGERVERLREFFGSTQGPVFGLHQEKVLREPFSWKKDVRLAALTTAVAMSFGVGLMFQPGYTWTAFGASILYSVAIKMVFKLMGGTMPETTLDDTDLNFSEPYSFKEAVKGYDKIREHIDTRSFSGTLNGMMPFILANVIVAAQFVGTANLGTNLLQSMAIQFAFWGPMNIAVTAVARRMKYVLGRATNSINSGYRFTKEVVDGEMTINGEPFMLYAHDREIFGCESDLTAPGPAAGPNPPPAPKGPPSTPVPPRGSPPPASGAPKPPAGPTPPWKRPPLARPPAAPGGPGLAA